MELHAIPSQSPRLVKTQALSDMDNVDGAAACIFQGLLHSGLGCATPIPGIVGTRKACRLTGWPQSYL
jgi:hypothetical protein